jgi:hypothetical protein
MKNKIITLVFFLCFLNFSSLAEIIAEEEEEAELSAYLRVWCALAPDQEVKEPGYRVPFKNKNSLILIPEKSDPVVIYNQLMPYMVRGYNRVPLGKGKIGLYEISKNSSSFEENRLLASDYLNLLEEKFYTVAMWNDGGKIQLKAWEDFPPILPPPDPNSPAPPPSRNLRVFNLSQGTRALVSSKIAGINLPIQQNAWPNLTNIKPGNWSFVIQGITGNEKFERIQDLDFTQPANYSIVLIKNVYNKTSVRLFQDAVLQTE